MRRLGVVRVSYSFYGSLVDRGDLWLLTKDCHVLAPDFARAEIVYHGEYTRIWKHPDRPGLISKISRVKTLPRDMLRKYWRCQARREVDAAAVLTRLGLRTPDMLGYGFSLEPWARRESILFMRELPHSETLRFILRESRDDARRARLLAQVGAGYGAIYAAAFHHKDCHFDNILCDREHRLIWIDNDLRYSQSLKTAMNRFTSALEKLYRTTERFLHTREWYLFLDCIAGELEVGTLGRQLAQDVIPGFRIETTGRHLRAL